MRLWKRVLGPAAVMITAAVFASPAMASSTLSSISLSPSTTQAAATNDNLGLDLGFTNSGTDSPQNLTLQLPPGLLANAAADNGQCLKSNQTPSSACQIGSGTVTVHPDVTIPVSILPIGVPVPASIPISVSFYLVPPPTGSDLAGIEVYSSELGTQLGSTGQIVIRPSGDPDGVGATVALTLPDTLPGSILGPVLSKLVNSTISISVTQIQSTFDNLRNPATCPRNGLPFYVTSSGYGSGDGPNTLSQPLNITGCSSLPYNPKFSVTAAKDSNDKAVALTTNVTQGSTEAPNGSIGLTFPTSILGANLHSLPLLCLGSLGGCTPVGSVTAVSPLYPTALTGTAYLTGTTNGLTLTLVFPSPFPLTLTGTVSLVTNTAAFSGLPDIPLTQLSVKLNGGSKGLFDTACRQSSGTATGKFVTVNNDQSRTVPANFTISGCPGSGGSWGSGGSGSGSGSGGGWSSTSSQTSSDWNGTTHLSANAISGLRKGRPSLRFTVAVRKHAAKFSRLTVMLPTGLTVRTHRVHKRAMVRGVSIKGAKIRSLTLSHHHLVVTLRRSARKVTVTLGTRSLKESHKLQAEVERKAVKQLRLKVAVRDARHKTRELTVTVHRFS